MSESSNILHVIDNVLCLFVEGVDGPRHICIEPSLKRLACKI